MRELMGRIVLFYAEAAPGDTVRKMVKDLHQHSRGNARFICVVSKSLTHGIAAYALLQPERFRGMDDDAERL